MVHLVKDQVVILSTADFDSAVWTNKQHLAVGLSADHDVTYIESLGLRQPKLSVSDFRRIANKIKRMVSPRRGHTEEPSRVRPEGLRVVSPLIIPLHKYGVIRYINKRLLNYQVDKLGIDAKNATLWTFSPLTYGIESKFAQVVYHSVDLLHTLPRVPADALQNGESQLFDSADYVIASSKGVKDYLESRGASEVLLWENVAHVEVFVAATGKLRHDRAVFAGNLTPSKIDLECLQSVLDTGIDLVIAGPIDIDGAGSSREIAELLDHPNVTYFGNISLSELAAVLATSKVGLIPYAINDYTRGVFPMKVYEYLASGLSIASTALPSLEEQSLRSIVVAEPAKFGEVTRNLMSTLNNARISENILIAQDHSWTSRIRQASELIKMRKIDKCVQ